LGSNYILHELFLFVVDLVEWCLIGSFGFLNLLMNILKDVLLERSWRLSNPAMFSFAKLFIVPVVITSSIKLCSFGVSKLLVVKVGLNIEHSGVCEPLVHLLLWWDALEHLDVLNLLIYTKNAINCVLVVSQKVV